MKLVLKLHKRIRSLVEKKKKIRQHSIRQQRDINFLYL